MVFEKRGRMQKWSSWSRTARLKPLFYKEYATTRAHLSVAYCADSLGLQAGM